MRLHSALRLWQCCHVKAKFKQAGLLQRSVIRIAHQPEIEVIACRGQYHALPVLPQDRAIDSPQLESEQRPARIKSIEVGQYKAGLEMRGEKRKPAYEDEHPSVGECRCVHRIES